MVSLGQREDREEWEDSPEVHDLETWVWVTSAKVVARAKAKKEHLPPRGRTVRVRIHQLIFLILMLRKTGKNVEGKIQCVLFHPLPMCREQTQTQNCVE